MLALDLFCYRVRKYIGAYLAAMNGTDAVIFTGGIGENSASIREAVCAHLDWFGIRLDSNRNAAAKGEAAIHADGSRVQLWTMPTNEEIIVARQDAEMLREK